MKILKNGIFYLTLVVILIGCFDIESVDQPTSVTANSVFSAKIKVHITCTKDIAKAHFIFGFLVPRIIAGAKFATVSYTSTVGNGVMYRLQDGRVTSGAKTSWSKFLLDKYGNENNIIDDMIWNVYETRERFSVHNGDKDIQGIIDLSYNAGPYNLAFKSSYFIGNDVDGFENNNTIFNAGIVAVKNGQGNLKNFFEPTQVSIVPKETGVANDLEITLNADLLPNLLADAHVIYLNSIVYSKKGTIDEVNRQDINSKLVPIGNNNWRITINPSRYYDLHDEKLDHIVFSFSDGYGHVLSKDKLKHPFVYKF